MFNIFKDRFSISARENKSSKIIDDGNKSKSLVDDSVPKGKSRSSMEKKEVIDAVKVKPKLNEDGLSGFLGKAVNFLSHETEAIPEFIGAHLLSLLSVSIPREQVRIPFGAKNTVPRINFVLVAPSGAGKGLSESQVSGLIETVNKLNESEKSDTELPLIAPIHAGGLSSGEGLTYAFRDDMVQVDGTFINGIDDKRLHTVEEEFASLIKMAERGEAF